MASSNSKFLDLQQNPEVIMNSPLNTSSAKMQYSFGQSQRFDASKNMNSSPSKFYDLPSLWSKKGASIGKSHRVDFSKLNANTPSPNNYSLQSSFLKKKNEGITMGMGRQYIKYRDMFQSNYKKSPDAASYKPEFSYNTRSFSMGQKLDSNNNKWVRQVPGPGQYPVLQLTNNINHKPISKYQSAFTSQFGKQKRAGLALNTLSPGPGAYQQKSQSFDQSLFEKPYAARFGLGQRRGLQDKTLATPGPGTYKAFSQFLR